MRIAMILPFSRLRMWLALKDYDDAKERGIIDIIVRYARGNVAFQNGSALDDDGLKKLSAAGDAAVAQLEPDSKVHET